MKKYFLMVVCFVAILTAQAQPKSADKGVTYGDGTTAENAILATDLEKNLKDQKFTGKIQGKVVEVCKEKGCWMKIERTDAEPIMIKFKDYGFFMPKNIVGKEVVLEGEATIKETSVKQLKHYAEDAGKSKEEIEKIKEPKKELIFVAKGVLVVS